MIAALVLILAGLLPTASAPMVPDRQGMARFGACVVERHHDAVAAVVGGGMTYDEALAKFPNIFEPDCVGLWSGATVPAQQTNIQFAIADALLQHDLAILPDVDPSRMKPLSHRFFGPREQLDRVLGKVSNDKLRQRADWASSIFARFGECMVKADAVKTRAIFRTYPDSEEERAALDSLGAAGNKCVYIVAPAKGNYITGYSWSTELPYIAIRGGIAVSYYRMAVISSQNTTASLH